MKAVNVFRTRLRDIHLNIMCSYEGLKGLKYIKIDHRFKTGGMYIFVPLHIVNQCCFNSPQKSHDYKYDTDSDVEVQ